MREVVCVIQSTSSVGRTPSARRSEIISGAAAPPTKTTRSKSGPRATATRPMASSGSMSSGESAREQVGCTVPFARPPEPEFVHEREERVECRVSKRCDGSRVVEWAHAPSRVDTLRVRPDVESLVGVLSGAVEGWGGEACKNPPCGWNAPVHVVDVRDSVNDKLEQSSVYRLSRRIRKQTGRRRSLDARMSLRHAHPDRGCQRRVRPRLPSLDSQLQKDQQILGFEHSIRDSRIPNLRLVSHQTCDDPLLFLFCPRPWAGGMPSPENVRCAVEDRIDAWAPAG